MIPTPIATLAGIVIIILAIGSLFSLSAPGDSVALYLFLGLLTVFLTLSSVRWMRLSGVAVLAFMLTAACIDHYAGMAHQKKVDALKATAINAASSTQK